MKHAGIISACVIVLIIVAVGLIVRKRRAKGARSPTLYDRLGGIFSIAAVVDRFSDEVLKSPIVGRDSPNPQLQEWSRKQSADRLPGLKFMRTLWVCDVAGGPYRFQSSVPEKSRLDLTNAHRHLRITSEEFDEVARILAETLDYYHVPTTERDQVLAAFAAHKAEVTAGSH